MNAHAESRNKHYKHDRYYSKSSPVTEEETTIMDRRLKDDEYYKKIERRDQEREKLREKFEYIKTKIKNHDFFHRVGVLTTNSCFVSVLIDNKASIYQFPTNDIVSLYNFLKEVNDYKHNEFRDFSLEAL